MKNKCLKFNAKFSILITSAFPSSIYIMLIVSLERFATIRRSGRAETPDTQADQMWHSKMLGSARHIRRVIQSAKNLGAADLPRLGPGPYEFKLYKIFQRIET